MKGRAWTADDQATLRRLVMRGLTDAQIGEALDRHPQVVWRKRHDLGLTPGQPPQLRAMMARINLRRMARA